MVVEFTITETLAGKDSRSQFNEFKKYLALEGENATDKKKGLPWIINTLFTAGVEVSGATDEALLESIQGALGTTVYMRAYGWKPEEGRPEEGSGHEEETGSSPLIVYPTWAKW